MTGLAFWATTTTDAIFRTWFGFSYKVIARNRPLVRACFSPLESIPTNPKSLVFLHAKQ